jgi:hypothetical protein
MRHVKKTEGVPSRERTWTAETSTTIRLWNSESLKRSIGLPRFSTIVLRTLFASSFQPSNNMPSLLSLAHILRNRWRCRDYLLLVLRKHKAVTLTSSALLNAELLNCWSEGLPSSPLSSKTSSCVAVCWIADQWRPTSYGASIPKDRCSLDGLASYHQVRVSSDLGPFAPVVRVCFGDKWQPYTFDQPLFWSGFLFGLLSRVLNGMRPLNLN